MPRGAHLSAASFASRHRLNSLMLWLHPPLMVAVGTASHRAAAAIALFTLPQVMFALLALAARGASARATLTSAGLISGTIAVIELSNGAPEAHFHIFVILLFVALYQQWQAIIATMIIGVPHHVVLGLLLPEHVFGNHHGVGGAGLAGLLGVHVGAFLVEIVGVLVFWHFAEKAEAETAAAHDTVRRERQRFQTLVQTSSDVVLVAGESGVVRWVSPAARHVMGYEPDDLVNAGWTSLVHPSERQRAGELLAENTAEQNSETRAEIRVRHANGDWRWHEVTIRNLTADPAVAGLVLNHRDVTERREYQDKLAYEASHDGLTGLVNRAMFFHALEQTLQRTARHRGTLAVLFVDLDGFKQVKDSLGHDYGDALLREVAERLRSCVRSGDTVARLGGDEFVVLLDGTTGEPGTDAGAEDLEPGSDAGFAAVVERIAAALDSPFRIGGSLARASGSVGVAITRDGEGTADSLVRRADAAMYREKRSRKNRGRQEPAAANPCADSGDRSTARTSP